MEDYQFKDAIIECKNSSIKNEVNKWKLFLSEWGI